MPPPALAATTPAARRRAEDGPTQAFAGAGHPPGHAALLGAPLRWPRPSRLGRQLTAPGGARLTGKLADGLTALGIGTVGELLEHLPRERRPARAIAELLPGEQATIAVEVRSIARRPVRRRGMRPLVQAVVFDATGTVRATFFNQPWLQDRYPPGTRLLLHGKAGRGGAFNVAHHAPGDALGQAGGPAGVAHYPASEGVSSTQILTLVREHRAALADIPEPLPAALRVAEGLPPRAAALDAVHFPRSAADAEEGRRRLAFEELLLTQLAVLRRRALRGSGAAIPLRDSVPSTAPHDGVDTDAAPAHTAPEGARAAPEGAHTAPEGARAAHEGLSARWLDSLPFEPTAEQRDAMTAVEEDLARSHPMQRLLMGEVGSGKTVVALHALLRAVEHGMQGALMAPTETLAEQHFSTLQTLVPDALLSSALLTGSTPARRRADTLGKLASGELGIVVGTHAMIEPDVAFARLAVAVVDEQHRFGVRQRAALDRKGPLTPGGERIAPHVLHMTATPIPRTLALTEYGDLDVTSLRELPRGRQPIDTHVVASPAARARAYERVREELRAGRQAYIVCPLVQESEQLQARAATAEFERLRDSELRGFQVELLHGQLSPREKQRAMARFASGEAHALVATTVIEVGVDVPNATLMLVEDAERYGISQLHQLRGRIGRGQHPSLCLLMSSDGGEHALRLRALVEHRDGFRLAEIDLELRGKGEIVGVRQHGQDEPGIANLPDDLALLERARLCAQRILDADPQLEAPEHTLLADALQRAFGEDAHARLHA